LAKAEIAPFGAISFFIFLIIPHHSFSKSTKDRVDLQAGCGVLVAKFFLFS